MSFTSRKKRPLDRTAEHYRDTKILIVATEGAETERKYFELFKNKRVQVYVIPNKSGKSSPKYILDNLDEYVKKYQIGEGDRLWLAIDRDDWTQKNLKVVCQKCRDKKYKTAISNPCFELWLLMHFKNITEEYDNCSDVKKTYSKQHNQMAGQSYEDTFLDLVEKAIKRAKKMDKNKDSRWLHLQGSRVYKIVEQLI